MQFPSLPHRALVLRLTLLLAVALLPAACGDLPEPFIGNPGATARLLAMPITPPMLAVPPPDGALLGARAKDDFAELLALSLQNEEVPSLARKPEKKDWQLRVSAQRSGDLVVPRYAIFDPSGHEQGTIDGGPLSASGWTTGAPTTLGPAAKDAAPKILALMLSIRRVRDRADPNSLVNRVAKLFVPIVTGAPGDGDTALTRMIRTDLAQLGPLVQLTPDGADFIVTGKVTVTPLPGAQQQVEIAWTVTWPSGKVLGKVSQLNSVPAGTLDMYWGDVASAVAQEASGGINAVVEHFIDSDKNPPGEGTAPPGANAAALPAKVRGPVGSGASGSAGMPQAGSARDQTIATPAHSALNATTASPAGSVTNKTAAVPAKTVVGQAPTAHLGASSGASKEGAGPVDGAHSDAPANPATNQ